MCVSAWDAKETSARGGEGAGACVGEACGVAALGSPQATLQIVKMTLT